MRFDDVRERVCCLMDMIRRADASCGLSPGLLSDEDAQLVAVACTVAEPSVVAPSKQEMLDALRLGETVDFGNSQDCFRVLVQQNNVLLREAIHRKHQPVVSYGAIGSGSLGSSLESPGSQQSVDSSSGASPESAGGNSKRPHPGLAVMRHLPKNFNVLPVINSAMKRISIGMC